MKARTLIILFIGAIIIVLIIGMSIELFAAPIYSDTMKVEVVNSEIHKANVLIEFAGLDSADEAQVKDIVSDVPCAKLKAAKLIEVLKNKDDYSSILEWVLSFVTALVTLLSALALIVKKIRALPHYLSPIHWFEKVTGNSKASLNGVKGSYKRIFVPEALETMVQDKVLK